MSKEKNNFGFMVISMMVLIVVAAISLVFILSASLIRDQSINYDILAR